LPSLARYFPGVLAVHPFGPMEHRPDVEEVSDCLACLARLGADAAAPILCAELGHDDRLHRWTAVWALSQLKAPGALPRLTQRLFDPEPSIAALAAEVLDGYRGAPGFQKALAQVRDLARRGDDFERQRAILAVGELRDREALTALVDLLGTRPKEIAEEARRALVEITKQDFGAAERRWRAWIADNEKVPRTRWLIEGLSSKDDDVRKSAQAELNRLTGQFFGYRWDAPRPDRDTAVAQWNAWWEQQQKEAPGKWP
jgi:HEAT repeat protein